MALYQLTCTGSLPMNLFQLSVFSLDFQSILLFLYIWLFFIECQTTFYKHLSCYKYNIVIYKHISYIITEYIKTVQIT